MGCRRDLTIRVKGKWVFKEHRCVCGESRERLRGSATVDREGISGQA
jgi:hypothetical protein